MDILSSHRNGALYFEVTINLVVRVGQRREHVAVGFTRSYGVIRRVWYEMHAAM